MRRGARLAGGLRRDRRRSAPRGSSGSLLDGCRDSRPAGMYGSESSGSRRPSGESPGIRYRLPRRSGQRSLLPARGSASHSSAGSAARSRSACRARVEHPRQARALLRDRPAWNRRDRRWPAGRFLLQPVARDPRTPAARTRHRRRAACAAPSAKRSASSIARLVRPFDVGDQVGVLPDRLAVLAPVEAERPARQAFAGIPLALAVMQQAARREARRAARRISSSASAALGRADRRGVPLRRLPGRRPRRRSARRPWSGARRRRRDRRRPARRAGRCAPRTSSEYGLVIARRLADARDVHLEARIRPLRKADRAARSAPPCDSAACRRAGCGPRPPAGPRWGRSRSSRRRADRPRPRRADR